MTIDEPDDWVSALQSETVRFLADAIPGPVSYLDREFRYRFVNARYGDFLLRVGSELNCETILGRTPTEAYGEAIASALLPNLRRALGGERLTIEVGLPISRTLNSYIPHVVEGEVVGVLLVAQDVTALHASKNAVLQAERMATLGRLMAGLLHEINTPIGVVRSALQTLARGIDRVRTDAEPDRAVARLEALANVASTASLAVERIISMVERLRSFARVDEAEVQTVDLHEGLDSALALLGPAVGEAVAVVKRYGPLPRVECRPAAVNQVYMALLTNAVRAVEGKGTITIRTWADAEWAHVEVADTGVGIERERLASLFTPSFAAGAGRVRAGIGLYVAHNIAEQHRGSLRVESELGRGSSFVLSLPLQRARETT